MCAENRIECSKLEPTRVKFAVGGIVRIRYDETADIGSPVGIPGERIIQAGGNLTAKGFPVWIDIAGPYRGGVALRPGKPRARQDEDALLVAGCALALINRRRRHQWKKVG